MLMIGTNACLGEYNNLYNPFILSELQAMGLLVSLNTWYLAYLGLFFLCVMVGLLFQFALYKKGCCLDVMDDQDDDKVSDDEIEDGAEDIHVQTTEGKTLQTTLS